MSRALWLLLWLQLVGWLRYLGRNLRTVRGALLALVGLSVFLYCIAIWLFAVLLGPGVGGGMAPDQVRQYGPAMLVVYCILNVLFSSHERAIYFTLPEIQFLFTGPFGRREVLTYKLLLTVLVSVPATLVMGAFFRIQHGWALAVLLGLLLISVFMQLFSMALGLMGNALGEQLYGRGRRLTIALLIVCAAVLVVQARGAGLDLDWRQLGEQVLHTPAWRTLSWPLQSFFDVMLAQQLWPDLVAPLFVASAVLVFLVGLIFGLDAGYQEASAAASARVYAKIQRMRGRSVAVEEPVVPTAAGWSIPTLPFWGGVGPICWRQMTSALRGLKRLIGVLFILGVALAAPILGSGLRESEMLVFTLPAVGAWLSVFMTALVPFDFRGDIDRIAILKTLPIVPWRLALGQLLTPALLLALMQWMTIAVAVSLSPAHAPVALVVAAYVPVFSFLVVAIENLLFLLFPVRIMAATPGDFQAVGRNVLLAVGKMMGLMIVAVMAFLAGGIVYVLTGQMWLAVAAAWPVVAVSGAVLVPLCGLAFVWFDVGRDTPA